MLVCVHGGGFSSKCKSWIKLIRSRINVIKKKKEDTIGFLKNAMAELMKKGQDIDAYGRVPELISELNRLSCYELIERFCACIVENLSSMQKQRVCPPESTEAVSTLMFAAARFADLPELYDLRCIFNQRYGDFPESAVSQEFVSKIESSAPSVDQKIQLMRSIAQEFSIRWDFNAFRKKMSNPAAPPSDRTSKVESLQKGKHGATVKPDNRDAFIKDNVDGRSHNPPDMLTATDKGSIVSYREEKTQLQSSLAVCEKPTALSAAKTCGSGHENACEQTDNFSAEAHRMLVHVRRKKQLKMLAHEHNASPADNGPNSRSRNGRRSHGVRQNSHITRDDEHDEEDVIMDKLLVHYSKKSPSKISRPHNGSKASALASEAAKSPSHENNVKAVQISESSYPAKKGLKDPHVADASRRSKDRRNVPARASSNPLQPKISLEATKEPVRAASLEPKILSPHVHPKLPDYDDLAAHFAALKREPRKGG